MAKNDDDRPREGSVQRDQASDGEGGSANREVGKRGPSQEGGGTQQSGARGGAGGGGTGGGDTGGGAR